MKIWDYIKDKLFNKKKALPEPIDKTQKNNNGMNATNLTSKKQVFDETLKVDIDIKPNTLEFAIEQYMASLISQERAGKGISPYKALIQLGAIRNLNSGNNRNNENKFLEDIDKDLYGQNAEVFDVQKNLVTGEPAFYHVSNCGGFNPELIKYRIYLNCKKENVALLASEFAKELEDKEYYFKFNADQVKYERSEQFVFYMRDEEELNTNMMAIERVKQKNPKLFEGANCVNPFMKTVDGYLAYAPDLKNNEYVDLNGNTHLNSVVSYNDLISNALKDSFVHSAKEIAIRELNVDLSQYNDIYQILGSKFLETIYQDDNLKMKFIESVKQNLKIASEKNPTLDIKGLDSNSKNSQKNFGDYTPESY